MIRAETSADYGGASVTLEKVSLNITAFRGFTRNSHDLKMVNTNTTYCNGFFHYLGY
jgi:hypothetical protein